MSAAVAIPAETTAIQTETAEIKRPTIAVALFRLRAGGADRPRPLACR